MPITYTEFVAQNLKKAIAIIEQVNPDQFDLHSFQTDIPESAGIGACGTLFCAAGTLIHNKTFEELVHTELRPYDDWLEAADGTTHKIVTYIIRANAMPIIDMIVAGEITNAPFTDSQLSSVHKDDFSSWLFGPNGFDLLFERFGEGSYDLHLLRLLNPNITKDMLEGLDDRPLMVKGQAQKDLALARLQLGLQYVDRLATTPLQDEYSGIDYLQACSLKFDGTMQDNAGIVEQLLARV